MPKSCPLRNQRSSPPSFPHTHVTSASISCWDGVTPRFSHACVHIHRLLSPPAHHT
jgi:hypothetical protein